MERLRKATINLNVIGLQYTGLHSKTHLRLYLYLACFCLCQYAVYKLWLWNIYNTFSPFFQLESSKSYTFFNRRKYCISFYTSNWRLRNVASHDINWLCCGCKCLALVENNILRSYACKSPCYLFWSLYSLMYCKHKHLDVESSRRLRLCLSVSWEVEMTSYWELSF